MNIPFYDSHCHLLNLSQKDPSAIDKIITDLAAGRLAQAIDIGTEIGDFEQRFQLMQRCGIAWFSLGLYPSNAANPQLRSNLEKLDILIDQHSARKAHIKMPSLVAIGEIGIDCHWNYATTMDQTNLFIDQIELANKYKLPIIVHNRQADEHIRAAFISCPPAYGGIMHCFSSDYAFATHMLDYGFYISFAGNLTYKKSLDIQETAKKIPLEKIVLETDAPYLSPVPMRGSINNPANIHLTYKFLSELRGISLQSCALVVEQNLKAFIKVGEGD